MTVNENRINSLFEELVPPIGKADSLAGEIIRATCRIGYRYFNDGDYIGIGYGKETCNPAARFLLKQTGTGDGARIASVVEELWGLADETAYEQKLDELNGLVADYISNHPELRKTETEDMFSCTVPSEDRDDDYEMEEYE